MLYLRSVDRVVITTSSSSTLDYVVNIGPPYYGEYDGSITSATTTVITPSIIPVGEYGMIASITLVSAGSNTVTFSKRVGSIAYTIFKASLSAGDVATYNGSDWRILDSTGKLKVTYGTGGGGGGADGGNILAAGTQTADSTGTVVFQDGNGMTFGMDSNTITASYTVPTVTQFQHSSLMSNYLGNTYTSHTHSQYLNVSQSSLLQPTSLMSNYLGTSYTSHTHSQYINNSQSSLFQQTSLMSDYLSSNYTTHTHSDYINNSQSTLFQATSLMSNYLGTDYTSHTHVQSVQTQNMVSINNSTGAIWFENGNGITFGGNLSTITASYTVPATTQLQHTSLMSNYLGTDYTSHTHSQYLNTSQSSLFQPTSLMSDYLGTAYTSHTHSQYVNSSETSAFTTQSVQPVAASAANGSFNFSTLKFVDTNGVSFVSSTDGIRASVVTNYNSNSSLFQQTSQMSDYLGTAYTTHTHSQYVNNSVSSLFQQTSLMSNYLGTGYTTHTHSQYVNNSQSSLFQQTSLMSNYLDTNYTTHTHSQYVNTSVSSAFTTQSTQPVAIAVSNGSFAFSTLSLGNLNGLSFYSSNGSVVGSYTVPTTTQFLQTSQSSLFQHTSAMTNYVNTSISSNFQQTSLMSNYLGTGYTTHTHPLQSFAASGSNGSFLFSTLQFGNLNGMSFYTSNGSIVASYTDAGAGGGIALGNSETVFTNNSVYLSAAGAMTIASTTGQSFQLSVPATSSLSATGQLSISVNGNTISMGVPAPITMSGYNAYADLPLVAHQQGNGTLQFDPDWMPNVQFDRVVIPMAFTNATNLSGSQTISYWVGVYTKTGSSLSLLTSASASTAMTQSGTVGSYSLYSGMRLFTIGMTNTFTEGQYWMAFLSRTTSGGANASISHLAASNINSNFVGHFGSAVNTTMQFTVGQGVYTVTTSAMPASVAFSQIRGSDSAALRGAALMFASSTI